MQGFLCIGLSMTELDFIAAKFVDYELPQEKKYLLKYFYINLERQWLLYYLMAGNYRRFTDHTGYACTRRWLRKLRRKLEILESAHDKARQALDISLVATIESGKMVVGKL